MDQKQINEDAVKFLRHIAYRIEKGEFDNCEFESNTPVLRFNHPTDFMVQMAHSGHNTFTLKYRNKAVAEETANKMNELQEKRTAELGVSMPLEVSPE